MQNNNVKLIWAVLCQESSIDTNTNNISLFKVLEEIKFGIKMEDMNELQNNPNFDSAKPIILPFTSQLVILWKNLSKNPDLKFPVKIILKDPNEKIIQETINDGVFQKGKERLRVVTAFKGFPLTKAGEYTYYIMTKQTKSADFKEIDSIPIKVNIVHK